MKEKLRLAFLTSGSKFSWHRLAGLVLIGGAMALALHGRRFSVHEPKDDRTSHQIAGVVFATLYDVKIIVGSIDDDEKARLRALVEEALEVVDERMSCHREGSDIDRLNRAPAGHWVPVSEQTLQVLELSRRRSAWSGGAFDITVGPLVRLWGFHDKKALVAEPLAEEIQRLRQSIGMEKIEIDPTGKKARKLSEELRVDLSAIAKGYAVDLASSMLEAAGYAEHLIEIGGEIQARGRNLRREPWRIAVQNPAQDGAMETKHLLSLENVAVATSGDYRNYYEIDGKRLSHTIDPRMARPISHQLASVTVVHRSCAEADAMATALNVLGPEDGYALAAQSNLAALFLIRDGQGVITARATPEFEGYRTHTPNPGDKP